MSWTLKCGLSVLLLLSFFHPHAYAAIFTNAWVPAFKGIDYTTGQADTNEVRQQKIFAFRVDLQEPSIEFYSTPSNGTNNLETFGQTTTTFVTTYGVAIGINANFFSPVTSIVNDPRDLSGLAISRGEIVSPFEAGRPAVLLTRSNQVTFITSALANYTNYWTAVAGSNAILINGVPQLATCTTSFCLDNPRSAVGLSANGRYFYMIVIDGRQTGWSDGATLYETAQWLQRFGAYNGLNLDGGGSSALVKRENNSGVLLNRPSGGTQRVNGNHLGVFASAIAPVILSHPQPRNIGLTQNATFTVGAGGTTPLRYQWRFNGTNIASATNASYTRTNVQLSHLGYYSVFITNSTGTIASASASLVSTNPPTPPQLVSKVTLSNNAVQLALTADIGRNYSIQSSSNLVQWVTLTNFFNQQNSFQFVDGNAGSAPRKFYRVGWFPP